MKDVDLVVQAAEVGTVLTKFAEKLILIARRSGGELR